jgi:tRNA A-37 threonylcarbamoyl transferase component Bud32
LLVQPKQFARTENLCGFVMSPVGTESCSRNLLIERRIQLKDIFHRLYSLHKHSPVPIIHGDPRLANLIISNDGLVWIDIMESRFEQSISYYFKDDMAKLVDSIEPGLSKSDNVQVLLSAYGRSVCDNSLNNIVSELNNRLLSS